MAKKRLSDWHAGLFVPNQAGVMEHLFERVEGIEGALEGQLEALQEKMETLEERMETLEERVDGLEGQ